MNVKELIEILKNEPSDREIVMAIDPEESKFGLIDCAKPHRYKDGKIWIMESTQKHIDSGWTEGDIAPDDAVDALVLWPI